MKTQNLLALTIFAAALPAVAAPPCQPGQVAQGNNCVINVSLGWIVAGQGNRSIVNIYVPPNASGPIDFEITAVTSSLGTAYKGYFGVVGADPGGEGQVVTFADVKAGGPAAIGLVPPGKGGQFEIRQVCWDPSCTTPAPAGAVPNMLSLQFSLSSPNPADLSLVPGPMLTIQFLDGNGQVTWEGLEMPARSNSPYSIIADINLGATPQSRYVFNGSAATQPFTTLSISNLNNPNPISGTVKLTDFGGNTIAAMPLPSIPAGGAAGYLLMGRSAGDTLGLFPSSLALPAGKDGVFHGMLEISLTGLTPTGQNIILATEYNGNSMVNLPVFHSPIP
jgi:hypothetical protein